MPSAPGGKPYVDEPRHYVALGSDAALVDALETVGNALKTSMASASLYCAIRGMNPLLALMGLPELMMPAYLSPLGDLEQALPGLDVDSLMESKPTVLRVPRSAGETSRKPAAKVGFLVSQMEIVEQLAAMLRTKPGAVTTWAVVQHLNVVLVGLGEEPVGLPGPTRKKLPASLLALSGMTEADEPQGTLVPQASYREERRLAS